MKAGVAAAAVVASPFPFLFRPCGRSEAHGSLKPDPNRILDLPAGFSYRIVDRHFETMSDGLRVPSLFDGMACFEGGDGTWILMRNHEIDLGDVDLGPYAPGVAPLPESYDPRAFGGVTRIVIDPATLEKRSSNLVLTGTARNCAGGMSPWGWLSCEETLAPGHGYVFLAPIDAERAVRSAPIRGYGRFNHEAVAIDPETFTAYLTEDRREGCLYRFVPASKSKPFEGSLQALRIPRKPGSDTGLGLHVGDRFEVDWVTLPEPDSAHDTLRSEAQSQGAAIFARGEGIWQHGESVYISCTSGGPVEGGQIFRLHLRRQELELIAQSESRSVLDMPDNITVAPWGDLYMSEDGVGDQFIRGLTPDGLLFDFARNAKSRSEITGVCFSPDGSVLFANLQRDGLTLAITGPFVEAARTTTST